MLTTKTNLLAFDYGERRIGVAYAHASSRLAGPLTVLINNENIWNEILKLIETEEVGTIVVGLPRSLSGHDTDQTRSVRSFAATLKAKTKLTVVLQDEALTSRQAEAELRAKGKKFAQGDIDALAATYILEDYLKTLGNIHSMEKKA
ncbi:Holliday junction resolvase RuvX [Candidatus Saccharibacteria bacterium]|nr:Holliday junction resolvase RuvX [Candidatus Saccharibacteria bacterium]